MGSGMWKTTIREIKGSFGRYAAILAIVMLGVGLFSGLKATTPAMIITENDYLEDQNFFDFRLLSTIGFEEEDVEELAQAEEIAEAEGAVSADAICTFGDGGNESVYKFHTVPAEINRVVLVAGRMPESADECLLDSAVYGEDAIGTRITVTENNGEDTLEMFRDRTFTAVGIVRSPYYINFERGTASIGDGKITAFIYVSKEAFDCDYLTEIYVTLEQKYDVYTDEYEDYIDSFQDEMENRARKLVQDRYEGIVEDAWEKIDDAQAELEEKTADAERELADVWQEILDGEQELLDGEQELSDGEREIADGKKEIADHEQEILDAERELSEGEREIQEKEAEIGDADEEIRFHEWEVFDNEIKLAGARDELEQGRELLDEKEAMLLQAEKELLETETELAGQEAELEEQEKALAQQEAVMEEQEAALSQQDGILSAQEEALSGQETELAEKEAELARQEEALSGQETELAAREAELASQEAGLMAQEGELNGRKEELEQAYAMQAISREQYEEGMGQVQAGMEQLAEGMAQLQAGKEQLQAGKEQVQAAWGQLQAGKEQLQAGREQLAEGKAQTEAGKEQLQAGKEQLAAGKEQLEAGKAQIQDGLDRLRAGLSQIQDGKGEIQDGKEQIADGRDKIARNEDLLVSAEGELEAGKGEVEKARNELEDGKAELEKAKTELADGRAEMADGKEELARAKTDLENARTKLEEGKADLEEGKTELADAKVEYWDAKAEFEEEVADARQKIRDAQEELADLEEPEDYVLTRNTNVGYACYESDSNIVAAIANVFPVFFFLVAALICMTTMNRMVEEQRTQIGVLKALGYRNGAIMGKYLFYAGSAAAIGAAVGCLGGTWLFPKVIWLGYSIMYSMGDIDYFFDVRLSVIALAAALLCSMGAAWLSCRYELYSVPASLIRPKAPKSGKRIFLERITFIWKRMKFLHKVSVRNIVRYKKRFLMMVLGISGCTALLVTGFGIRDSVADVADMQYGEVQIYDIGITFSDGVHKADMEQLKAESGGRLSRISCLYEQSVDLDFGGRTKSVYMEIAEDETEMGAFVKLHSKDGEEIPYPGEGEAVLTAKIAENMGIKAGDEVVLRDNGQNRLTVKVSALCENFVSNYIYVGKGTYERQMGGEPEYKTAFAAVEEGADIHEAAADIADMDNVLAVSVAEDMRQRIGSMMESMDYIVMLIIACAGSLAFIVLYNLTNINITERIREIATIKVLGFYAKETADYVFRENLVLTGIGAAAGLGLGKWLHWFVMYNVNIDMISFKTVIKPASYLWSILLTFVFALLVNGFMYFKLEKINMAEALKSIE